MGVDAYFMIRFKEVPTETQIKHLRFHLLHRFYNILYWKSGKDGQNLEPVITKTEDTYNDAIVLDDCLYNIHTTSRYYGPGYERGPGLEIAALLIYLNNRSDIIESVYYGGDAEYAEYNLERSNELLRHWLSFGWLPYINWGEYEFGFYRRLHPNREAPICDWCDLPMIKYGCGGNQEFWTCPGCDSDKKVSRN